MARNSAAPSFAGLDCGPTPRVGPSAAVGPPRLSVWRRKQLKWKMKHPNLGVVAGRRRAAAENKATLGPPRPASDAAGKAKHKAKQSSSVLPPLEEQAPPSPIPRDAPYDSQPRSHLATRLARRVAAACVSRKLYRSSD